MISRTIQIKPTPNELAKSFLFMNNREQAEFLSIVSDDMSNWNPVDRKAQLIGIAEELKDSRFIKELAEEVK